MPLISRAELKEIGEGGGTHSLSLYMPTHRAGPEMQQDPIRLKSLTREAERQLEGLGADSRDIDEVLNPVRRMLDDDGFWLRQEDGLAIFSSKALFRYYRLPREFEALVVVADRFHIKPFLPLFVSSDGPFYVLALSKHSARLIRARRYEANEVSVEDMPGSLEETLRFDDKESQLQFHVSGPTGGSDRSATFHGHGVGKDDAKDDVFRYAQQVARAIERHLEDERAPLVLAGVDYVISLYKKASGQPTIVEDFIAGNPDDLRPDELRDRAWPLVEPLFTEQRDKTWERFWEFTGTGQASMEIEAVVSAAHQGRVETLFVPIAISVWGRFDRATSQVAIHASYQPGDEDLLDVAALHTILNRGTVHAVEEEDIPDQASVAAVFRF